MPYIFPKRRLNDKDVLDPIELNEDILPAMELYAGEVNEHNVSETVQGVITQPAAATHSYVYKEKLSDPSFGDVSSGFVHPTEGTASGSYVASHKINNDMNWAVVDSMTFNKITGVSKLWIIGQLTYIWLGFHKSDVSGDPVSEGHRFMAGSPETPRPTTGEGAFHPAGVQFALRVDGHLIEHTLTGKRESWAQVSVPSKATEQKIHDKKFPGPDPLDSKETGTMGPHCASVRLGTFYDVLPGTHTIEIVARRFPPYGMASHQGTIEFTTHESNFVHVYNRKLFTLDIPTHPPNSSADSTLSIPTFDTEDVVSAASLGNERINRMAAAFRNVQEGTLSRGALNHYHLSSPVIAKKQSTMTAAVFGIENTYPGYNTSTVTTSVSGNGWYLLYNGTEYLNAVAPTVWDISTESTFLIMANVQVKSVRGKGSATGTWTGTDIAHQEFVDFFGALALGYNNSSTGSVTVMGQTEVYVNHYNNIVASENVGSDKEYQTLEEEYDVALFAVVKSSDLAAAPNYFGVYGATMPSIQDASALSSASPVITTTYNPDTVMTIHRGHITVIQLKA
jgi:hypothetical protein